MIERNEDTIGFVTGLCSIGCARPRIAEIMGCTVAELEATFAYELEHGVADAVKAARANLINQAKASSDISLKRKVLMILRAAQAAGDKHAKSYHPR